MSSIGVKVVAFDFDGVFVFDSDAVFKREAWSMVFAEYAGRHEPFLAEAFALYGNGKSGGRVEMLQHVFEKLGESQGRISGLVARAERMFDAHVQRRIIEVGLAPGAMEMLRGLSSCGIALYINSGTATPALALSIRNLGVGPFFRGILGSTNEPVGSSKVENLRYILKRESVAPEEVLVVGDGDSDREAAQATGCSFLGVANRWNRWAELGVPFPYITDLAGIPATIVR